MSVLLCFANEHGAWIGCDSRVSNFESGRYHDNAEKARESKQGFSFGYAGKYGSGEVLKELLESKQGNIRDALKELPDDAEIMGFVINGGKVWEFNNTDECEVVKLPFLGNKGSGGDLAEGYFAGLCKSNRKRFENLKAENVKDYMFKAIEYACDRNLFCGGDIIVVGGNY